MLQQAGRKKLLFASGLPLCSAQVWTRPDCAKECLNECCEACRCLGPKTWKVQRAVDPSRKVRVLIRARVVQAGFVAFVTRVQGCLFIKHLRELC